MKLFIAIFFFLSGLAYGQTNFRAVMVDSNQVVQRPTNFFSVNRILTFDTNGNVVYTNTNTLTFTNILGFNTNIVAAVRTNLGIPLSSLTNTSNITVMRALAGSTNTNEPFNGIKTFEDYSGDTQTIIISNGIILDWQSP
jgi:hypothetical protein